MIRVGINHSPMVGTPWDVILSGLLDYPDCYFIYRDRPGLFKEGASVREEFYEAGFRPIYRPDVIIGDVGPRRIFEIDEDSMLILKLKADLDHYKAETRSGTFREDWC